MRKSLVAIVAGAVLASATVVLAAETPEITVSGDVLSFAIEGYRLEMPKPEWARKAEGDEALAASRVSFQSDPAKAAILEFVPQAESFDDWTSISAAAVNVDPVLTADQHLTMLAIAFSQGCEKKQLSLQTIPPVAQDASEAYLVLCGTYAGDAPQSVAGKGEILIAVIREVAGASVRVYEEFRGPAFDINDKTSWPIPEMELALRATLLEGKVKLTALPADGADQ